MSVPHNYGGYNTVEDWCFYHRDENAGDHIAYDLSVDPYLPINLESGLSSFNTFKFQIKKREDLYLQDDESITLAMKVINPDATAGNTVTPTFVENWFHNDLAAEYLIDGVSHMTYPSVAM